MSGWDWGWGGRRPGRGRSPLPTPQTARYRPARGIFGGTFDPPHLGHLVLAEAARSVLGLSEVVFMPAGEPPHKSGRRITSADHRIAMTRSAIADNARFALSTLDAERDGPSYSVDAMQKLRERWGRTVEIYFIMGADSLVGLPSWHRPERLMRLVTFAVVARPGFYTDMATLERALPGLADRVVFVPAPLIGISSTAIRQRVAEGHSIRYLVPPTVEKYIYTHSLYEEAEGA